MKKLLVILLSLLVLSGCGGNAKTSASCSFEESGMNMTLKVSAPSEDADIDDLTLAVSADYETLGITEDMMAIFNKEELTKLLEESLVQSFNEDENKVEVLKSELTDTAIEIELRMDIASIMAQSSDDEEKTVKAFVEYMEKSGATCK